MVTPDAWRVSLNEVEQLTLKAARGAGTGWGVAEDIARATRWMAQRQLDWSELLLLLLLRAGTVAEHLGPVFLVADLMAGARPGRRWVVEGCAPVWPLALLAIASHGAGRVLDLRWGACAARVEPDGAVSIDAPWSDEDAVTERPVAVSVGEDASPLAHLLLADSRRSSVLRTAWGELEAFASRTYVPASVQSRATGAGGGRVDAD